MNKFPQKLKELREERKMSQSQLADVFNVYQTTISKWEKGDRNPSIEQLIYIAKYFEVSVDYILGLKDLSEES